MRELRGADEWARRQVLHAVPINWQASADRYGVTVTGEYMPALKWPGILHRNR